MPTPEPSSRQFDMQIDIAAPRDAVWRAISTDTELRRWFSPDAEFVAEVGGEVVWQWGDFYRWPQRIEILEPCTRLRTRYDSSVTAASGEAEPLFIDFLLAGDGGHTSLRLVHSGFGASASFDEEYNGISAGWPVELRSLRHYLEHHLGQDRQLAWSMKTIDMTPDAAWLRLLGQDGFDCGADIGTLRDGDSLRVRCATGDVFECDVLYVNPRELTAVARSHGDAFFRITAENCGGETSAWLWLATYGQPAGQAEALQGRWDHLLEKLFAAQRIERTEGAK